MDEGGSYVIIYNGKYYAGLDGINVTYSTKDKAETFKSEHIALLIAAKIDKKAKVKKL